jgi:hygromycin-B 4-O-kinase
VLEPLPRVELSDARAFVEKRFGTDGDDVEYVGEGAWSRCFGFMLNGGEMVIRFGQHLDDFQRDRIAARFAARDLPIPQVIEIDEAFGAWYCVSTRGRGTPLELLAVPEWVEAAPSVLTTLDALRRADISATTGFGPWNHAGNAPHGTWADFLAAVSEDPTDARTHGWKRLLTDSPQSDHSFNDGYAQMLSLAQAFPGPRFLVHNDLLNRNALVTDGSVSSLFDWGCSIYGDFIYELATLVFWSPWYPAIDRIDIASMALDHYGDMGLDVPNFADRLRCCALHIGLVHLGYNAFLGDLDTLRLTDERMSDFLE